MAGLRVRDHGRADVGSSVDMSNTGLLVALVLFARSLGGSSAGERRRAVHCGDVSVRLDASLWLGDGMCPNIVSLNPYKSGAGLAAVFRSYSYSKYASYVLFSAYSICYIRRRRSLYLSILCMA